MQYKDYAAQRYGTNRWQMLGERSVVSPQVALRMLKENQRSFNRIPTYQSHFRWKDGDWNKKGTREPKVIVSCNISRFLLQQQNHCSSANVSTGVYKYILGDIRKELQPHHYVPLGSTHLKGRQKRCKLAENMWTQFPTVSDTVSDKDSCDGHLLRLPEGPLTENTRKQYICLYIASESKCP